MFMNLVKSINMIKLKYLKYSCNRNCNIYRIKLIDCICVRLNLIYQYESNEHRNKTRNQNITLRQRIKQGHN